MTPKCLLREYEIPVHGYLEQATRRFDQTHLGIGISFLQLGRQTGGAGFIVSDNAILDGHLHGARHSLQRCNTGPPRIVVAAREDAKGGDCRDGAPCQVRLTVISI
jgi:hypothetical protein